MRQTTGTRTSLGEKIMKDIKRVARKHYSSEEKKSNERHSKRAACITDSPPHNATN